MAKDEFVDLGFGIFEVRAGASSVGLALAQFLGAHPNLRVTAITMTRHQPSGAMPWTYVICTEEKSLNATKEESR